MSGINLFSVGDDGGTQSSARVAQFVTGNDVKVASFKVFRQGEAATEVFDTVLITAINSGREVAHQLEPTISGDLFINFFGDTPTVYKIIGMAFDRIKCKGDTENPVKSILNFYNKYKLQYNGDNSGDAQKQISFVVHDTLFGGALRYAGILIKMSLDTTINPEGVRKYDFSFTFIAVD